MILSRHSIRVKKASFIYLVLFLLPWHFFIVEAATISLPDGSGESMILPTSGRSLEGTDLYAPPAITREQALNRDFSLGDTSLNTPTRNSMTIEGLLQNSSHFLNRVAPFIISLTILVFLWGMLQLVRSGSEDARKEGRQTIIFGVVALFVMVSVWGLVNILRSTTGLTGVSAPPQGPGVPRFK